MKSGIHPEYRDVVFLDSGTDTRYVTRSTVVTKETVEHEGQTYPLVRVDISAASHPFYTGKMKFVDAAGRVEKFQKKYNWDQRKRAKAGEKAAAEGNEG